MYSPSSSSESGSNRIIATRVLSLKESFDVFKMILLSLVMKLSTFSQANSILSGSTSGGTDTEQITSCLCPTVFW